MYLTFGAILALLTFQGLVEDISTRTVRSKTEALEGPGININLNIDNENNFVVNSIVNSNISLFHYLRCSEVCFVAQL